LTSFCFFLILFGVRELNQKTTNMTEIQAERAAHILHELESATTSGKSSYQMPCDEALRKVLVATLITSEAITSEFITRLQYMKIEQAEAKEMRRLEGIKKRQRPQMSLSESIYQNNLEGKGFRRTPEGQAAQRKWDEEHGVERPEGFYITEHGEKGNFPRGLVGQNVIRIKREVSNV